MEISSLNYKSFWFLGGCLRSHISKYLQHHIHFQDQWWDCWQFLIIPWSPKRSPISSPFCSGPAGYIHKSQTPDWAGARRALWNGKKQSLDIPYLLMWLVMRDDSLWAKFARAKYFDGDLYTTPSTASPLWRSIADQWPRLLHLTRVGLLVMEK